MTDRRDGDHWAAAHVGRPWVAGISDCWSFAREIWRDRFGLDVPAITVDPADPRAGRAAFEDRSGWERVDAPVEGDAVLMTRGRRPCHVGIWLIGGRILHSVERAGVIITDAARLDLVGYRIEGIYRKS